MPRYFLEVAYKGTAYAGFQKQQNAATIQSEVEKALATYFRKPFELTGSSRTDAGVHARQNFFHFDADELHHDATDLEKPVYHLNAILPADVVIRSLQAVHGDAHCRFDAKSRTYKYTIYQFKNPFIQELAYYYPYNMNLSVLNMLARELVNHTNFESFSKRNTQVLTFNCQIYRCEWEQQDDRFIFTVSANRFLRGMVKAMVGTMLRSAQKSNPIEYLQHVLLAKDPTRADFAVPSHGLCLEEVRF